MAMPRADFTFLSRSLHSASHELAREVRPMPSIQEFPARGRVTEIRDGGVVFKPEKTTYELFLQTPEPYTGPMNTPIKVLVRAQARKVYSVPSGGNFVTPIFGPPRIIQGRVKFIEGREAVIQAGVPFVVELPMGQTAIDLNSGPIAVGSLINVVAMPGAGMELIDQPAPTGSST
jgi:hypothetical protein